MMSVLNVLNQIIFRWKFSDAIDPLLTSHDGRAVFVSDKVTVALFVVAFVQSCHVHCRLNDCSIV